MSASAKRRGITLQLFAVWGHMQEHTVAAWLTGLCVVLNSVVNQRQLFKFDTAIVRQSILLSSGQQFVDRIC